MRKRKHDDTTLILAGGLAAALLGASAASSFVWLRQNPGETARAHRHRATKFTAFAFGVAGALGAAAATALLGPKAAGEKDWPHLLEHLTDNVSDLSKRIDKLRP